MSIFTIIYIFMANQAELAACFHNELGKLPMMRAMATGTTFLNGGMGIGHPRRRAFMTLKAETWLLFKQDDGISSGMWLTRRAMTNQAITISNRCMDIFRPTKSGVTLSGQTSILRP
jgi:hypothetical protein